MHPCFSLGFFFNIVVARSSSQNDLSREVVDWLHDTFLRVVASVVAGRLSGATRGCQRPGCLGSVLLP